MTDPADLGVVEAAALLAAGGVSATELTQACLARIRERDGVHSFDGDPESINAWIRVYEEDALAAATRADERLASGDAPPLCGIPLGLKDLYAVAGKPLTASSRVLDETPVRDCDVWVRLRDEGMVLLGHLHTHEFAAGGTTDQVGNPWALDRSPGGSSGGSGAALAARMVPAATGTDTAGSLRIPSALCGTSTLKPTRGLLSLRGIVPLCPTLDHPGPMARTVEDCAALFAAMSGQQPSEAKPLAELRLAVSPRSSLFPLDADVVEGFDTALEACRRLGATIVDARPHAELDVTHDFIEIVLADSKGYHRRFDDRRELYRPALREWLEQADERALPAEEYVEIQLRRLEVTGAWTDWLAAERIDAVVEPTVPVVAAPRETGYDHPFRDTELISLTHYWDWTGFPVVALPSGVGSSTGLPVSVSLVGPPLTEWQLLGAGAELQAELGVPVPRPDGASPSSAQA